MGDEAERASGWLAGWLGWIGAGCSRVYRSRYKLINTAQRSNSGARQGASEAEGEEERAGGGGNPARSPRAQAHPGTAGNYSLDPASSNCHPKCATAQAAPRAPASRLTGSRLPRLATLAGAALALAARLCVATAGVVTPRRGATQSNGTALLTRTLTRHPSSSRPPRADARSAINASAAHSPVLLEHEQHDKARPAFISLMSCGMAGFRPLSLSLARFFVRQQAFQRFVRGSQVLDEASGAAADGECRRDEFSTASRTRPILSLPRRRTLTFSHAAPRHPAPADLPSLPLSFVSIAACRRGFITCAAS